MKSKEPSKSGQQIRERLANDNPEAILFDDLDDALIGVTLQTLVTDAIKEKQQKKLVGVYSRMEILKTLMFDQGIPSDDVIEYFEYNITGLSVGLWMPIIVEDDHDEAWGKFVLGVS